MDFVAIRSAIQSRSAFATAKTGRDWVPLLILFLPSIYILLIVPPLWRDSDGFNEIASTFALRESFIGCRATVYAGG
jgi:hypothetical protein